MTIIAAFVLLSVGATFGFISATLLISSKHEDEIAARAYERIRRR